MMISFISFSDELPESLIILNFKGNPCTANEDYRYMFFIDPERKIFRKIVIIF